MIEKLYLCKKSRVLQLEDQHNLRNTLVLILPYFSVIIY